MHSTDGRSTRALFPDFRRARGLAVAALGVGLVFGAGASIAQVPSVERQALVALYNATDGDNWFNAEDPGQPTGWLGPAGTECTWAGVFCDPTDSFVEALILSEFELFGALPPEIGDLSGLVELALDGNYLEGTIPPELSQLQDLELLDLFDNNFVGQIPPELGQLASLEELYLDFNFLTGGLPSSLGGLSNLQVLVVAENFLGGDLPGTLTQLTNLLILDLYDNQFTGPVPSALAGLTGLQVLDLGFNQFSGSIPNTLGQLQNLESLFLDSNQLTGFVPSGLVNLPLLDGDLRWNGLQAAASVEAFFDGLVEGDFASTQTRAPLDATAKAISETAFLVTWSPIEYSSNDGGYLIQRADSASGPFQTVATVDGKASNRARVDGVPSGSSAFVVRAFTSPHEANPGTVTSDASLVSQAATASASSTGTLGFTQPVLRAVEGAMRRVRVERIGGTAGPAAAVVEAVGNLPSGLPPISFPVSWLPGEGGVKTFDVPIPLLGMGSVSFDLAFTSTAGAGLGAQSTVRVQIESKDLRSDGQATVASTGDQPRLGRSSGGRKVAVWSAPDGDKRGVFAQRYDASGQPDGEALQLNSTNAGTQSQPAVAVDSQGGFVAVWRSQSNGESAIVGRLFDPSGSPRGPERQISQSSAEHSRPSVGLKPNGEAYVAWQRTTDDGGQSLKGSANADSDVVGAFLDTSGQNMTSETEVSGTNNAGSPSVSVSDQGDVAVAFEQETDTGDMGVALADVQPSGSGSGLKMVSQAGTTASQPQATHTASGDTLVVYQQQQSVGGSTKSSKRSSNIVGRLFDPQGSDKSGTVPISDAGDDLKKGATVSSNDQGDCYVAWQSEGGSGPQIQGKQLEGCSQPMGSDMTLSTSGQRSPGQPATLLDDDGSVTTVFTEDDVNEGARGVTGVRVGSSGGGGGGGGGGAGPCVADQQTLCLNNDRFRVRATWRDFQGGTGTANVVKLTNDTGYFWFFDSDNVEILLKVLDACTFADSFWTFAGGLTSVAVNLEVTDTVSGEVKTYTNPLSTPFQPIQDTAAFSTCNAAAAPKVADVAPEIARARAQLEWAQFQGDVLARTQAATASAANCTADGQTLCLNNGRFQVKADWRDFSSGTGVGMAVPLTSDTGYFWFFSSDNVEVGIKVLDACDFSGSYWVFAAGLTNVETTLTVTDTESGAVKIYMNPLGTPFAPIQDTAAFETCSG